MGCKSCGTGGCGTSPAGCKNNGGCKSGGCNKLNVFDWLSNMELPQDGIKFNIVEVRFKNGRKEFYKNDKNLELITGDAVAVEAQSGHHIGYVSMMGELVRLQLKKRKITVDDPEIKVIYRKASTKDLDKYYQAINRESPTLFRTREIINQFKLEMKLSDVEYQGDNTKATFYYSAEGRVDFRELIRQLAAEFKIRVEMRQISLRQEAGRLGGIGVCGRELCCSTWLVDFKNVSTSAARYQNLSLNPGKLSGQCGRLKCCLNYELETYMEALKDIPDVEVPLKTSRGDAILQKTDIFRKIMWFGYKDDISNWIPVPAEKVKEILAINAKGELVETLIGESEKGTKKPIRDEYKVAESNLEHLDKKYASKKKKKKNRKKKNRPGQPNQNRNTNNNEKQS